MSNKAFLPFGPSLAIYLGGNKQFPQPFLFSSSFLVYAEQPKPWSNCEFLNRAKPIVPEHTIYRIIFRALQGIGASGINCICQVIGFELVSKEWWPVLMSIVSVAFCLSEILGPILGGVISTNTTWRWVFLLR